MGKDKEFRIDAIELSRRLRTETGIKLASMSPKQQVAYINTEAEKNEAFRRLIRASSFSQQTDSDRPPFSESGAVEKLGAESAEKGNRVVEAMRHTAAQIVNLLLKVEGALANGEPLEEVWGMLDITVKSYYRWRKEYGDLDKGRTKLLNDLENEIAQLIKRIAQLALDKSTLEEGLRQKH